MVGVRAQRFTQRERADTGDATMGLSGGKPSKSGVVGEGTAQHLDVQVGLNVECWGGVLV